MEISLLVDGEVVQNRTFSHLPKKRETANCEAVNYYIETSADGTERLVIETKEYLQNLFITAKESGVRFENNFIDLLPGKHFFSFSSKSSLRKEDILLNWM